MKKLNLFRPQINDIFSTKYYIIYMYKSEEFKVVQGAFIRGHFNKCRVLSDKFDSQNSAIFELNNNRDNYFNLLTMLSKRDNKSKLNNE